MSSTESNMLRHAAASTRKRSPKYARANTTAVEHFLVVNQLMWAGGACILGFLTTGACVVAIGCEVVNVADAALKRRPSDKDDPFTLDPHHP